MNDLNLQWVDWHDYYTYGEMLRMLAERTNEDVPTRFETDTDIEIELALLISKHEDEFRDIIGDLANCVEEYGAEF